MIQRTESLKDYRINNNLVWLAKGKEKAHKRPMLGHFTADTPDSKE